MAGDVNVASEDPIYRSIKTFIRKEGLYFEPVPFLMPISRGWNRLKEDRFCESSASGETSGCLCCLPPTDSAFGHMHANLMVSYNLYKVV